MQGSLLQLRAVEMFVPGVPITQGSKKLIPLGRHRGNCPACKRDLRKMAVVDDEPHELEEWRSRISGYARVKWPGPPTSNPVCLTLCFWFPRERVLSNGQRQTLKGRLPSLQTTGDMDKLTRAVMDALAPKRQPIVYVDDARVVAVYAEKRFASGTERAGVLIRIEELEE